MWFGGGPPPGKAHKTVLKSLQTYSSCEPARRFSRDPPPQYQVRKLGDAAGRGVGSTAQLPFPLPSSHGLLPVLDVSLSLRVSAARLPFPPAHDPPPAPALPVQPPICLVRRCCSEKKKKGVAHTQFWTSEVNRPPASLDSSCARDGGVGGLIRGGEEAGGGGRGGAWQLAVVPSERTSCGCVVRVSPVGPGRHQLPRGEEAEAAA